MDEPLTASGLPHWAQRAFRRRSARRFFETWAQEGHRVVVALHGRREAPQLQMRASFRHMTLKALRMSCRLRPGNWGVKVWE